MSQHTPTPWHRNVSPAWKYPIYADKNGNENGKDWIHIAAVLSGNPNAEADLDFIVRAVNSHDALVKFMKDTIRERGFMSENEETLLRGVGGIAQAEGKL